VTGCAGPTSSSANARSSRSRAARSTVTASEQEIQPLARASRVAFPAQTASADRARAREQADLEGR
jgi:hypothetical protein